MDISTGDEFENGADDRHDVKIKDEANDKIVTAMNRTDGLFHIAAKTVILAMGCRERARGALNIPGYRPAGIFSAGTAQRLVNIEGYMPGRKVVILGSGDIGLIMARRMTLEGAKVQVVAELMPYSGGLKRNIVQCLDDFVIPLKLSHTVVDIKGRERVEGITLAQVDEHNKPIEGTEEFYECDTLLLSCGLIPENEISKTAGVELNPVTSGPVVNESLETNVPGVFACGNVLHVHDLVDYVSEEATAAGRHAAEYVKNGGDKSCDGKEISITATDGVRYTVPSTINTAQMDDTVTVRFRVGAVYKNCYIAVYLDDKQLQHRKRPVMAPGEMEQVVLKKKELIETDNPRTITIKIEEKNLTCIGCPLGCALKVTIDGENVTVTGNTCKRGADYGAKEVTHPTRIVTSTVCVKNGTIPMVSVKTAQDIPKEKIMDVMECINQITVEAPVHIGDVLLSDVAATGVDIVATKNVEYK